MQRRTRRILWWTGGALGLFVAVSALVHLPAVQYAMGWTNPDGTGACPFGDGAARVASDAPTVPRSGPVARTRPALGFTLGTTTRAQLASWATQHAVTCTPRRGGTLIECGDVPAALLADHGAALGGTTAWFELDDRGVLTTVKMLRRATGADPIARAFAATELALTTRAGAPAITDGSAAPEVLASGAFRQATRDYRFADYRALVRATNLGDGYVLTESYTAR
ncbi:MAG: hypothetical protein M3680_11905 [Myxococcota bacterium]|nr:hypothetical protein [Myxococcota bacterium]